MGEISDEAEARQRLALINEMMANFERTGFAVMPMEYLVLCKVERSLSARIQQLASKPT